LGCIHPTFLCQMDSVSIWHFSMKRKKPSNELQSLLSPFVSSHPGTFFEKMSRN